MYKLLPYQTIMKYMPYIMQYKVSERARQPGQFLDIYKKYGANLPAEWKLKRDNFIKRHLAQYKPGQTRRRLALITWAYDPKI